MLVFGLPHMLLFRFRTIAENRNVSLMPMLLVWFVACLCMLATFKSIRSL